MFTRILTTKSTKTYLQQIERLRQAIDSADSVVIGAGAGLSTSAGFVYSDDRFKEYFSDFIAKYGFQDMYSGGFTPFLHQRNIGRIGADIFTSTAIKIRLSRFMIPS